MTIEMATSSEVSSEPLLFYLAFARREEGQRPRQPQPMDHPAGLRLITRLRVTGPPHERASAELRRPSWPVPG